MGKTAMGPQMWLYPMPTVLVGANVDNKPNFMTAAWCSFVAMQPPTIGVTIRNTRYTGKGIKQNMAFSVNLPSSDMLKETDYCGITSGANVNKVDVCKFTLFYGKSNTAPMIEQCPLNIECSVTHTVEIGIHTLFIGKIEETYISDTCLADGKPDLSKIKPFAYVTSPAGQYQALGQVIGKAFSIGKELEKKT